MKMYAGDVEKIIKKKKTTTMSFVPVETGCDKFHFL